MKPAPLLAILLPLLFGGCGKKDPVAEVKTVEEKQQEVKPTEEAPVNPIKYKIAGDAVTITDCDRNASGALIIPATIEGKPVTRIGVSSFGIGVFDWCHGLTSITIPDSVTSIGRSAFNSCSSLTSITIGDSVTSIGAGAFDGCRSLTTIEVGAGNANYTVVDGVLFNAEKTVLLTYPAGKTGDNYDIPNSVTSIGRSAFNSCSSLTSITIGDSVTSIGYSAFSGCRSLTSITIPEGVTSIGNYAFVVCPDLTSITIPDSVTSIGDRAFLNCASLTSITIGNGVTSIGDFAFNGCTSLTSITIPENVTSIGKNAFAYCSSLTTVTFLGDAPKIASGAFRASTSTIYRNPEAKGWGDTFDGRPVKLISEKP